ncbi:TadE/TadG family type IV pilus assembly protein [Vibrio hepatarius]|uniref:TadE/TadG family type IV pilus assembly protein n=1 Tax=Vibrio hepatarius TaxID=171383 RepID=UPI001C0A4B32|nr:hypothetical protein [Vibrio hepatarius]MBU2896212.1 hypothetical protein [Vibrio hepatarius]
MRKSRKNQRGVLSIEVAIGFLIFISIILTYFEMARYIFVTNMVSVWNYEVARDTRIWDQNESDSSRKDAMLARQMELWQPVLLNADINVNINYFANFAALRADSTGGCKEQHCRYMEFVTTYDYAPMFPLVWFVPDRRISSRIVVEREWLYGEKVGNRP